MSNELELHEYTYTITLINSEVIDTNEYTSLEEAIESAKASSKIFGCDAVIKRDDGEKVGYIRKCYVDAYGGFHNMRIEYME